ncbi:hypothetical protein JPH1_31560 [Mycobacterium avium subsp. hominissuis]|uniref:Uncharacterized protein n=1 Tax=Mycobacterium avium subsp. hominissuis TaxID=439334 RepID=A0AAI8SP80_MYCAV|nr:hypothetical protein JPH1_31560 [Mycobacterium avium subsp. hominissuis]
MRSDEQIVGDAPEVQRRQQLLEVGRGVRLLGFSAGWHELSSGSMRPPVPQAAQRPVSSPGGLDVVLADPVHVDQVG